MKKFPTLVVLLFLASAARADEDIPAKAPGDCDRNPAIAIHYEKAYKTLKQAEDYKPGARGFYVDELDDKRNEYLLSGISPKFRADWFASHKLSEKDQRCFVPVFDAINAAAKRTLAGYTPRKYDKPEGNEDEIIRNVIKQKLPGAEVLGVGVKPAWDIEKLSNGIPKKRFKHGMAWVKSANFDDGYCRIAHVNIIQDYAGGGTYADSKGLYINALPSGCK